MKQKYQNGTSSKSHNWTKSKQDDRTYIIFRNEKKRDIRSTKTQLETLSLDTKLLSEWDRLYFHNGLLTQYGKVNGDNVEQIVILVNIQDLIFQSYHGDLGYQGRDPTIYLIKRMFYWKGIATDIGVCRRCGRCIRHKTKVTYLVSITSNAPMEQVQRNI